jgi:hypothetical protein
VGLERGPLSLVSTTEDLLERHGPQDRLDGPQDRLDRSQKRLEGPQERLDGPQDRLDGLQDRYVRCGDEESLYLCRQSHIPRPSSPSCQVHISARTLGKDVSEQCDSFTSGLSQCIASYQHQSTLHMS